MPKTGKLRFIEVKGRRADARGITITRSDADGSNTAESYILAAVWVENGYVHDP